MKKKGYSVTLKDIAAEVGITPAAVSRALRDKHDIGQETKEKVREAARKLGYRANIIARNLRTGVSNVLGVLVPDNEDPYYARVIKGVEETAKKRDYIVAVFNTNEDRESEARALATLLQLRIGGVLAVPVDVKNYRDFNVPLAFISRYKHEMEFSDFNYVINDDTKGVYHAVRHILSRGRKDIYFINGPKDFHPAIVRLEGFKSVLGDEGIRFSNKMVIHGENSMDGGYRSFQKLIEYAVPPFGLFCCSDYIAIGVMKAIREMGYGIPEDISLVGYDDIEMVNYLEIPITTIKQARYEIGAKGAENIINMIEDSGDFKQKFKVVLEPELVIRKST